MHLGVKIPLVKQETQASAETFPRVHGAKVCYRGSGSTTIGSKSKPHKRTTQPPRNSPRQTRLKQTFHTRPSWHVSGHENQVRSISDSKHTRPRLIPFQYDHNTHTEASRWHSATPSNHLSHLIYKLTPIYQQHSTAPPGTICCSPRRSGARLSSLKSQFSEHPAPS